MNKSEQLIACLEGEIANRDEELAACRVAVENCELFRARIAELEARIVWLECEAQVNAAPVSEAKAMTNTIHNVPRELLERAWRALANSATGREIGAYLDADPCAPECAETCARASMCSTCSSLLSAPSPAGVDADHVEDVRAMVVPSIEAAYAIGAKGGSVVDAERLAFESWMAGHCWALCAAWDGSGYRCESEQAGQFSPAAGMTRRLWAAWRDRAALAAGKEGE